MCVLMKHVFDPKLVCPMCVTDVTPLRLCQRAVSCHDIISTPLTILAKGNAGHASPRPEWFLQTDNLLAYFQLFEQANILGFIFTLIPF